MGDRLLIKRFKVCEKNYLPFFKMPLKFARKHSLSNFMWAWKSTQLIVMMISLFNQSFFHRLKIEIKRIKIQQNFRDSIEYGKSNGNTNMY